MITIDDVKNRLNSLGYEVSDDDTFVLNFIINKVEQHIKHYCNINEVPESLGYVAIDMTCGEFLQSKKSTGQLTALQIEPIVKRITDGDSTVEFTSSVDNEAIFNAFVSKLISGYEADLLAHRCIVW